MRRIIAKSILLVLYIVVSSNMYAQVCLNPTVTKSEYCDNQSAIIEVDDADNNVRYGWYNSPADDIPDYGVDGEGREYNSPNTQTAPNTFYYQKEVNSGIGPNFRSPAGGLDVDFDGTDPYLMPFDNDVDFLLKTVTVIVRMESPTENYGFSIVYDDGATQTYGPWLEGQRSDFLSIGSGLYRVEIPVDIEIAAGTGRSLEFAFDDTDPSRTPVDGVYWWGANEYNGANYIDNDIRLSDPDADVDGTTLTPLLMDWDIDVLCPRQSVTTTLSSVCCTPVGGNFSISAPTTTPTSSDFPMTLTASGPDIDASMYYYWYDADNVLLDNGQGVNTLQVTAAGQYSVRVVNEAGDEGEFACYARKTLILGIKSIFAPDDFSICLGDPITLRGEGAEGNYNWYSDDADADSYIVDKNVQETDVYILEPGTFTYVVEGEVKLGNVASDGKFENWTDDATKVFESAHGYVDLITGPGQYEIDDEITAYSENTFLCPAGTNPDFWEKTDPVTNDVVSRGQIFIADAVSGAPQTPYTAAFASANPLWRLPGVVVEENTCYTFTADVSNWNTNTAPDIMFLVNGVAMDISVPGGVGTFGVGPDGSEYYEFPENDYCRWETIEATWCSGPGETSLLLLLQKFLM